MDKGTLKILIDEYMSDEGNYVYLHLSDGSELFVNIPPKFFNLHIQVVKQYDIDGETVKEIVCIPYKNVIYVTLTNSNNLEIIAKQYEHNS